jgi:ribosomal protein S18 acetylase RimI-like enzyme
MQLNIQPYQKGDFESFILPLDRTNMKDYFDRNVQGGWSDEKTTKTFYELLEKGEVFLLNVDSELVGYVSFYPDKTQKDTLFVYDLQIENRFQREGLGSKVCEFLEKTAIERDFEKIRAFVFVDNPAFNLYQRLGYKEVDFLDDCNTRLIEKKVI